MATFIRIKKGPKGIVLSRENIPCTITKVIKEKKEFIISYYSLKEKKEVKRRVKIKNMSYQLKELPIDYSIEMPVPYKD